MHKPSRLTHHEAPGRLNVGKPVAIIDVGSNSVRLVAYEGLTRSPTPIFNEKVLCGLGKGLATSGKLPKDSMEKALNALRRFRVLCETLGCDDVHMLATAAARDAKNGKEFLQAAEAAAGVKAELLSGAREAHLSALGVVSSIWRADGVVGDLGGGSLELIDVKGHKLGRGVTLPLGGLALADASGGSVEKAQRIARSAFAKAIPLERLRGRTFYAVGGTWRALGRLHMMQRNYPLHVMQNYVIPAEDAADFASLVERVSADQLIAIESVNSARRPLLAYGAVVLEELIRKAKPKEVVISANGVREGLLYERLKEPERHQDPLISGARELNILRSRSPQHGEDLCHWTDSFMRSLPFSETPDEKRLRHAACLLADIGWRAHPDYRGEQSINIIANADFTGVDHPGRAFLALTTAYRHMGLENDINPRFRSLLSARQLDRSRIIGAAMRVAYIISAAMPHILPRTPMKSLHGRRLVLTLPQELRDLANERLNNRLKQLARVIGDESEVKIV
ncbi:exopolyphosphatase [Methylovirgula sp. 4M-Z18]|uniref:exopolyphosphatase n=1 Tax=Methylovirgula sp. 4M-Z18 TaxID=2293567 RepID=UPI00403F1D18